MPNACFWEADMSASDGLGDAGKALLESVSGGLPSGWELDEREEAILTLAAHQADDLAALEAEIAVGPIMTTGSTGQDVLHPAVQEARQARLAISRLLGSVELPDADEKPKTSASQRGQHAANERWRRRGAA
jgi:hypothetical protein